MNPVFLSVAPNGANYNEYHLKTGVALRSPPAGGLASPSGLLFSAERPIKSTILRAPQIDPEQTARAPSLALMIRSNFGLSLV